MTATYIGTREIPLDQLTRFPGNARRGDVEAIRASLRRDGQYRSLTVRDTGDGQLVILNGNNTAAALAAEGRTAARCEVVTCDDVTARRINLNDNRLNDLATYDAGDLAELLDALQGDYAGTGWDNTGADEIIRQAGLLGDRTSGFLDDFTGGGDGARDPGRQPAPGDAGEPAASGGAHDTGHAQVQWLVTLYQRDVIHRALAAARDRMALPTFADALASICRDYLEDVEPDGDRADQDREPG